MVMLLPIKGLSPEENRALIDNLALLTEKRPRALLRSNFYNTKNILDKVGFSIPPSMRDLDAVLGWPTKAVDSLSGRLKLDGFVVPGKSGINEDLDAIFSANRMMTEWPQTQGSTLTHGVSFVAVTPGDVAAGEPKTLITTMPATEATGIWDVRTRRLSSAMWLPDADNMLNKLCILFMREYTVQMTREDSGPWQIRRIPNKLPRVPVTPVVHRAQLGRPFGMSRISRPVIYLCQMAARTLLRTEVGAEFFNAPQRYAMGASGDDFKDASGNTVSSWETILGRIWLIDRDEDGNIPEVGQFPQQTMQPNVDMMRMITTLFSGETSLPVSSLGIIHDNPTSAAAIDAAWADMVELAELCQVELGVPAVEIAQNAFMTENGLEAVPEELLKLRAKWRNAATPTIGAMTDAVVKQISAGMLQPDSEVALEQAGYDRTDIVRIRKEHEAAEQRKQRSLRELGRTLDGVTDASGDEGAGPPQPGDQQQAGGAVGAGVAPARPAPPR